MSKLMGAVLLPLALVLPLGACGDDGGGGGVAAATDATVAMASTPVGDVLVDGDGRTLYLFTNDADDVSTCTGGCASAWPPLRVDGDPVAGDGVDDARLATNGDGQVTYAGRPLYRFAQDAAAGDVKGQGVGGVWFTVDDEGRPVRSSSSSTTTTTGATMPVPSY